MIALQGKGWSKVDQAILLKFLTDLANDFEAVYEMWENVVYVQLDRKS